MRSLGFVEDEVNDMVLRATPRSHGGVTVVECSGRLILGEESANLRMLVKDLLAKNDQIVLDLGGVDYIDSHGLGTLAGLYATAQKCGGNIKLANLNPRMRDMLQMTRLITVFEVYANSEEASASFQRHKS